MIFFSLVMLRILLLILFLHTFIKATHEQVLEVNQIVINKPLCLDVDLETFHSIIIFVVLFLVPCPLHWRAMRGSARNSVSLSPSYVGQLVPKLHCRMIFVSSVTLRTGTSR